jgi:hypothetical protein
VAKVSRTLQKKIKAVMKANDDFSEQTSVILSYEKLSMEWV